MRPWHGNRKYGELAPKPQAIWQDKKTRWRNVAIDVRGKMRHLRVHVSGPFLRKGAAECPLMLIVVKGKHRRGKRAYRRQPLPFLVNAVQDAVGHWSLPLPLDTLLFWAWQRWEVEVAHRELKTTFGLGHKQCFNPNAAVLSVQWSAWVYSLLLLAGYRTFGLARAPDVPHAGGVARNVGPLPLCCGLTVLLCGDNTISDPSLRQPAMIGLKNSTI